jgi:hypothetical protein
MGVAFRTFFSDLRNHLSDMPFYSVSLPIQGVRIVLNIWKGRNEYDGGCEGGLPFSDSVLIPQPGLICDVYSFLNFPITLSSIILVIPNIILILKQIFKVEVPYIFPVSFFPSPSDHKAHTIAYQVFLLLLHA